jgi:hypothetical protein
METLRLETIAVVFSFGQVSFQDGYHGTCKAVEN